MASAEEKLARLEEMVEALKRNQQQPVNVTVTAPTTRKLRMFSGRTSELHYWIGEARSILPSVSSANRLSFLIAHLEGSARKEVKYAPSDEKDCIDKIFTLMMSTVGETRSNAQLKRELYDRIQGSRESVREFSRALLKISEGLTDKAESKDNMLIEVFCENLLEPQIKREIKRLLPTDPKISFGALRSEAIQLEEDGLSGPHRSVRVREVHEPHHASDDPSPLDRIAAQLELLATTQSEIVSLLRAQQQRAAGVAARSSRPEPRSSGPLNCEYCRRRGHAQNTCWKRASDIRRTDEQSGVHAYGDQSDTRAMRGGPVARSMSGPNVPVPRVQLGN